MMEVKTADSATILQIGYLQRHQSEFIVTVSMIEQLLYDIYLVNIL